MKLNLLLALKSIECIKAKVFLYVCDVKVRTIAYFE